MGERRRPAVPIGRLRVRVPAADQANGAALARRIAGTLAALPAGPMPRRLGRVVVRTKAGGDPAPAAAAAIAGALGGREGGAA